TLAASEVAEPGSTSSARSRERIGSSDASAAAGSSITVTSSMRPTSHRQKILSILLHRLQLLQVLLQRLQPGLGAARVHPRLVLDRGARLPLAVSVHLPLGAVALRLALRDPYPILQIGEVARGGVTLGDRRAQQAQGPALQVEVAVG